MVKSQRLVSRPKDINSLSNILLNSKIGIKTANMYIALCSKYCSKHCAYVHPLNPDQQSYEVGIIFSWGTGRFKLAQGHTASLTWWS